jgi:hypothetical protein
MADEVGEFDYLSPTLTKKKEAVKAAPKTASEVTPETVPEAVPEAAGEAVGEAAPAETKADDFSYLSRANGQPAPDYSQFIADAQRDANLWAGGELGAVAGASGPIVRGLGSLAEQKGAEILGKVFEKFPGLSKNLDTGTIVDQTPGGKWGAKTGYGVGSGSVQDVSSKYQRRASKGKISSKLDKLYGVKMPGEPDSLVDRMMQRNQAAQTEREIARQTALAEEPSFGKEVVKAGKNVGNWLGSTGYGILHGMNLANQLQEALDAGDQHRAEMIGHLISAAGSTADLVSNFTPETWRHGLRQNISPLAMIGAGSADVAKGYGEVSQARQPGESQADYEKRTTTGAMRMPGAVARTAIGMANPLTGFAMMAPPLSPEYAMAHPEQARQWASLGAYDNPELTRAGIQSPLSRYERKVGAGRGVVNPP